MSDLIDTIAELNASRDRDALEITVLSVIAEVFDPLRAAFFKVLSLPDGVHVHERLRYERGGTVVAEQLPENLRLLARIEQFGAAGKVGTGAAEGVRVADHSGHGRHVYVAPVRSGKTRVAWIEIETEAPMGDERTRVLAGLVRVYANHIAVLDYSERDALTGLRNRKTFNDTFLKLLSGTHRDLAGARGDKRGDKHGDKRGPGGGDAAHWLAMADIDRFKRVNDRYGHLFGDEVLVMIAHLMRESFRVNDRLYRFGGEEFAVLLDRTTGKHAAEVFERFRRAVQAHVFPQVGEVTISIGYTRIRPGDTPSGAFERADSALYHAKQGGRNRVDAYEDLVAAGVIVETKLNETYELF